MHPTPEEIKSKLIYETPIPVQEVVDAYRALLEERDFLYKIRASDFELIQSLRTELAAKDKVLEWYADKENYGAAHLSQHGWIPVDRDEGELARSILSQYRSEINET